ncbi:MAG: DUF3575 domain-containing protein [Bacteroidales bacterium]|nr:DUF3575 domain-containing protein [Bacteroidales bacterium]
MIRKILAYHVVAILCCLLSPCSLSAETRQLAVSVGFPVNKTELLPGFGDNAAQLAQMEDFLSNIDPVTIDIIRVDGYASPEGPYRHNLRLAEGRAQALIRYIAEHTAIPAEKLAVGESHLSWEALRPLVEESEMKDADTVLALIDVALADQGEAAQLDAIGRLQRLNSGAAWREMKRKLFPQIRYSQLSVEIIDEPETEPVIEPEPAIEPEPIIQLIDTVAAPVTAAAEPEIESYRHLYLKTNGVGWAMLVSNLAVELDIAPHWSATLPVYYSGLNFFGHKVKFRTFTIQPEGRYWLRHDDGGNHGLFVGAHFGLGWYNYAINGKYRTQDHDGNTPAIGGGVAVGCRMRLAGRWSLEFSVGAGVYDARYDKYLNEQNGARVVSDRHRTWVGIDQAAVSIVYAFPVKKGGGR